MRLAMTGERLSAEQALELGLVEKVVDPDQALKTAGEEALAFAKLNTESLDNGRLAWSTRLETREA